MCVYIYVISYTYCIYEYIYIYIMCKYYMCIIYHMFAHYTYIYMYIIICNRSSFFMAMASQWGQPCQASKRQPCSGCRPQCRGCSMGIKWLLLLGHWGPVITWGERRAGPLAVGNPVKFGEMFGKHNTTSQIWGLRREKKHGLLVHDVFLFIGRFTTLIPENWDTISPSAFIC